MIVWLILGAMATGTVVAVAASSSGGGAAGNTPPPPKSIKLPARLQRSFPPPPPFYPPNIYQTKQPLVWWSAPDGSTEPAVSPFNASLNSAIDVTGRPWTSWRCDNPLVSKVYADDFYICPTRSTVIWVSGKFVDAPDIIEQIETVIVKYVAPVAITFVGAWIGGVGGAAAAMALSALLKIATGARIDRAVVEAYSERMASAIEKTTLGQTYNAIVSTNVGQQALANLKQTTVAKSYLTASQQEDAAKAFDIGVGLGRAQRMQNALIEAIQARITPEEVGWMNEALLRGVALSDWVTAMFGDQGAAFVQAVTDQALANIDAGRDPLDGMRLVSKQKIAAALGKLQAA